MIEFKNVSFAYGALSTTQSMTDATSKDTLEASEGQSPRTIELTLDNVTFTLNPGSRSRYGVHE